MNFLWVWNELLLALVFLQDNSNKTLMVGITGFQSRYSLDILVNAVAPGFVATRMTVVDGIDELDSELVRTIYLAHGQLPLGRVVQPQEVAEPVVWLASSSDTDTTGQVITVDGGLTARL